MSNDIDPDIADEIDAVVESRGGIWHAYISWKTKNTTAEDEHMERLVEFYATSMPFNVDEVMHAYELTMSTPPAPPKPLPWRLYDAVVRSVLVLKWRMRGCP